MVTCFSSSIAAQLPYLDIILLYVLKIKKLKHFHLLGMYYYFDLKKVGYMHVAFFTQGLLSVFLEIENINNLIEKQ